MCKDRAGSEGDRYAGTGEGGGDRPRGNSEVSSPGRDRMAVCTPSLLPLFGSPDLSW